MPHGEMLARMPASEVTEWAAYEQVTGPLGAERDDVLATMIAFYVVSALSDKKGRRRLKLDKMLPKWGRRKPQTPEAMEAMARALTTAHGGEVR